MKRSMIQRAFSCQVLCSCSYYYYVSNVQNVVLCSVKKMNTGWEADSALVMNRNVLKYRQPSPQQEKESV